MCHSPRENKQKISFVKKTPKKKGIHYNNDVVQKYRLTHQAKEVIKKAKKSKCPNINNIKREKKKVLLNRNIIALIFFPFLKNKQIHNFQNTQKINKADFVTTSNIITTAIGQSSISIHTQTTTAASTNNNKTATT